MEKNYISKYYKEGYLRSSRRIYAGLIDSILLIIASFIILISGMEILQNCIPQYKSKIDEINIQRVECYKIEEEAKLYEFNTNKDGLSDYDSIIKQEDTFKKYCLSNITYSYNNNETTRDNYFKTFEVKPVDMKIDDKIISEATFDNDYLGYFYSNYIKTHDFSNILELNTDSFDGKTYFKKVLKDNSIGTTWNYNESNDLLPVLNIEYSATLYGYLFYSLGGQEGLNSYNFLVKQYQNVWKVSSEFLFKSNEYSVHYNVYKNLYASCSADIVYLCLISYLIGFLLAIVLPTLLFKNGRTLGLFIFKGAIIDKDGLEVSKTQIFLRLLIQFFTFFGTMVFTCFMGGGLNTGWMYPLINIGSIGISFFHITTFSLLIPIVNLFLMVIRKNKTSLVELASRTLVIDTKYFENNPPKKGLEEVEKVDKIEKVAVDNPYFDSSIFNNKERDNKSKK